MRGAPGACARCGDTYGPWGTKLEAAFGGGTKPALWCEPCLDNPDVTCLPHTTAVPCRFSHVAGGHIHASCGMCGWQAWGALTPDPGAGITINTIAARHQCHPTNARPTSGRDGWD